MFLIRKIINKLKSEGSSHIVRPKRGKLPVTTPVTIYPNSVKINVSRNPCDDHNLMSTV